MCIRDRGITARDQRIELPIAWTDAWGNEHDTVSGNPVAFHAMRAVSYTHLRAHETVLDLVCRLLLDKKTETLHHTINSLVTTHKY